MPTARVVGREVVTDTAVLLTLEAENMPPAPPGSHIDVELTVDGRPIRRSYSLVDLGDDDGRYRLCVRLHTPSRGGSRYMHEIGVGAELRVSAPIDEFAPQTGQDPAFLLAAGIGVTPLTGIANALRRRGVDYRMLCVAPNSRQLPLFDRLHAAHGDRLEVHATSVAGRPRLEQVFESLPADTVLYVCGPLELLEDARTAWHRGGRPINKFRCETFGDSGHMPSSPFTVFVRGRSAPVVVPTDVTMLEALRGAGEEVLFDCRRGECGLCALDILEVDATIDHRDVFFSAEEHSANRRLCVCVSRVTGGSITVDIGRLDREGAPIDG